MVELKQTMVADIPLIEVYEKGKENETLPTVVFYHGWESRKERVLEYGYRLANKGFRALLPEALHHGERKTTNNQAQNPMNFWEIVASNVKELPLIMEPYITNKKTDKNKIGVAGLSMGGITTSAILTQYEWIKAAAILMGSPSPIAFTEWLLKNYEVDDTPIYELLDRKMVNARLKELEPISLDLQPEKIAHRPLYVWHGTADPIVPVHLTRTFFKEAAQEPYGDKIKLDLSEGVEHTVPGEIVFKMAEHFSNYL